MPLSGASTANQMVQELSLFCSPLPSALKLSVFRANHIVVNIRHAREHLLLEAAVFRDVRAVNGVLRCA